MSLPDDPLFCCLADDTGGVRTQLSGLAGDVIALLGPLGFIRPNPATRPDRLSLDEHGGAAVLRHDLPLQLLVNDQRHDLVLRVRLLALGPYENEALRGKGWLHVELEPGRVRTGTFLPGRADLWFQKELCKFERCPEMSEQELSAFGLASELAAVRGLSRWFVKGLEQARAVLEPEPFEHAVCEALAP